MEVPLTAFGSLRPLFRYRSIPPLRSGTPAAQLPSLTWGKNLTVDESLKNSIISANI